MTTEDLIHYLQSILTQQKNILILQNTLTHIDNTIPRLGHKQSFIKPTKPTRPSVTSSLITTFIIFIIATIIIGTFIVLFTLVTGLIGFPWHRYVLPMFQDSGAFGQWFGQAFFIGLVVSAIVAIPIFFLLHSRPSAEAIQKYRDDLASYEKSIRNDNERVASELQIRETFLRSRQVVQQEIDALQDTLYKLYSLTKNGRPVLYKDYRDFVAIATIIGYLNARKCFELEGPHGAYNLYDQEKRYNIILTKLNVIIDHLEEIRQSQSYLYETIHEMNNTISGLNSNLSSLSNGIEDSSTYQRITAENTSALLLLKSFDRLGL